MHFHILSIGRRSSPWIADGFQQYAKRLPKSMQLQLQELAPSKRYATAKGKLLSERDRALAIAEEGESLLAAIPAGSFVVALDERGREWTTLEFAHAMQAWQREGKTVSFLIGGADGLADECKQRANQRLALSRMTLPHQFVRVFLAEQIYRAWSLLSGHPYHRA